MARSSKRSPKITAKKRQSTDKKLRDRDDFQRAVGDPNSPLSRAAAERFRQQSEPSELVAFRMPTRLKAELEETASAAGRTLSGEMRFRLDQSAMTSRMLAETLGLLISAIKAKVPHEQLEKLIEIHMESLERKRL